MAHSKVISFPKTFTQIVPAPDGAPEMMVRLNITVTASLALKIFALLQHAMQLAP